MEDATRKEPPKTMDELKEKYCTNLGVLEELEEEDGKSDDSDNVKLKNLSQPRSLSANNLGFDVTLEEKASLQNGLASAKKESPSIVVENGKDDDEKKGKHLASNNNGVVHGTGHVHKEINAVTDVDAHSTMATNDEEDSGEPGNKMAYCVPDIRRRSREVDYVRMDKSLPTKQILNNVSVYFNPGELVAIMGPSGCGKTTLLDLLTGRRRHGHSKVSV